MIFLIDLSNLGVGRVISLQSVGQSSGEVWRLVGLVCPSGQSGALLQETWRMRVREERGVIRYHWRLIPRLLQTKSDSMLDGGWQREGNKHK